ncbi:MAG: sulfite exporter TauE/SafE family protein [candidate division KSB1 bacterium]|nr:sulfite exporter TauE/SafE family protein [candidate division KSB1 bacterium]MDZ7303693.1 sulfite exporter TauE/SafE family protein [candidate division KSB1 bacterium]MDZ7313171.1 sulfite exporter TauE/SafE family protein [candidate division KSB1 bacterium]
MLYAIAFAVILLASFLFAMLGLGGGMVYVPVLKWAGFPVKEVAIPLGLLMNGLNTLLALIPFSRQKLVDWKGGAAMAVSALVLAPVGAYSAKFVPVTLLLGAFAVAVIIAAVRTLIVAKQPEPETMMAATKRSVIGAFVGGFAGFLGGMLGIGGGFIIAPILMWMGYKTKAAAATTAFVVTFSSFSGFMGHVADGRFNWSLTVLMIVAVLIGSQLGGNFMATKAKPKWVKQLYAVVLFVIAAKLLADVF